jgi:hypothetical protein
MRALKIYSITLIKFCPAYPLDTATKKSDSSILMRQIRDQKDQKAIIRCIIKKIKSYPYVGDKYHSTTKNITVVHTAEKHSIHIIILH